MKKDSFVRNGKEVTSYRNSSGQFTKKPYPYNYSINAQIPLINLGGQEYSHELISSGEITLGNTTLQTGMTAYGRDPYLVFGLHNGLSTNIGWQSGILVANADLDNGGNISANIFETAGIAGLNIGKSGFGAKAGFKASIANVKYSMPISETCFRYACFEGDVNIEFGSGINAKAEIDLSNKKIKATEKGQALRKQNTEVNKAIEYFSKFTGKELAELNEFIIQYGVQKMPEQYGFKIITINNARKELPQLDKVIKDGIKAKRSVVARLGYKKRNKEKPNKAKKIQVIVNTTLSGISDQTEVNLANFKKMIERNKQLEHVKRLKNGDFDNMI